MRYWILKHTSISWVACLILTSCLALLCPKFSAAQQLHDHATTVTSPQEHLLNHAGHEDHSRPHSAAECCQAVADSGILLVTPLKWPDVSQSDCLAIGPEAELVLFAASLPAAQRYIGRSPPRRVRIHLQFEVFIE